MIYIFGEVHLDHRASLLVIEPENTHIRCIQSVRPDIDASERHTTTMPVAGSRLPNQDTTGAASSRQRRSYTVEEWPRPFLAVGTLVWLQLARHEHV